MLSQRDVFGDLVILAGIDDGRRMLEAVDDAGLQCRIDLPEGHGRRAGAHGVERGDIGGRLDGANLETFKILRLLDFLFGGDDVPVAPAILPSEHFEAQLFVLRRKSLADLAVEDVVRVVIVAPHERQVEHPHPLVEIVVNCRAADVNRGPGA